MIKNFNKHIPKTKIISISQKDSDFIISNLQNTINEDLSIFEGLYKNASKKYFSEEFLNKLNKFKNNSNSNILLIKNLPVEVVESGYIKNTSISELLLLSLCKVVGQPYGYLTQRNGEVIQNLYPKQKDSSKQLGTSSQVDLY